MPITEGIVVPITADTAGLEDGFARAKAATNSFAATAVTGVNEFADSLEGLKLKLAGLQGALQQAYKKEDITRLAVEINIVTKEIEEQTQAYIKLGATSLDSANKANIGFGSVIGSARRLQFVLRTLGGVGLFAIFSAAYSAIEQLAGGVGNLSKEQKKLNEETSKFEDEGAKELIKFKELTIVAADHKLSMNERTEAIKKLRNEYGPYLQGLTNEQILTGQIATAYQKITDAVRAKIALQVLEEKVIPIIKEQLDLQLKQNELQKTVAAGVVAATDAKARANEKLTEADKRYFTESALLARNAGQQVERNIPILQAFERKIQDAFSALKPFIEASAGLGKGNGGKDDKEEKAYDKLIQRLETIKKLYTDRRIDNAAYNKESLADIDSTIKGLDAEGIEFKKVLDLYDNFLRERKNGALAENIFTIKSKAEIKQEQKDLLAPKRLPNVGDRNGSGVFDEDIQKNNEKRKAALDELNKRVLLAKQLTDIATTSIIGLFKEMSSGVGIAKALEDMFKNLAEQIAEAALKALIFSTILNVVAPGSGGLVKGGTSGGTSGGGFLGLFKSFLGLASGGITNGPTLAMIGEGKEREVVTPLSQLKNIIGNGGGGQSIPEPRLFMKGADFWIAYQRAQLQSQRNT